MDIDIQNINEINALLNSIANSSLVHTTFEKMKVIKTVKEEKERDSKYEEIINGLLSKNQELLYIAQTYKSEYERVNISDEDIKQLKSTARRVINLMNSYTDEEEDTQSLESLVELIDIDTLKTMQLLGFNYKEAIGKPLTELCANQIKGLTKH